MVLEPRILYAEREEYEFDRNYRIPLGQAEIVRPGTDVTLLACGAMVRVAREAAERSEADVEVIDMLTLWPWDRTAVLESVARTGRLVTLEEAPAGSGWGGDVVALVATEAFGALKAPPHRITLPDAPVPYSGAARGALSAEPRLCRRADRDPGVDQQSAAALVEECRMTLSNSNSPLARREALEDRRRAAAPHDRDPLGRGAHPEAVRRRPYPRQHAPRQRTGGGLGRHRPRDRSRRHRHLHLSRPRPCAGAGRHARQG